MMGHREPLKGGDEFDAFTPWRRLHSWRAGTIKAVKRAFHKRTRKSAKASIGKQDHDDRD